MNIYCSHCYGGKEKNKQEAERKIKALQLDDLDNTYISPINTFGFMYEDIEYYTGLELCFNLLQACDKLLVLSEESTGVRLEIQLAKKLGIEVEYESNK